jgi:hypothetical protein
MYQLSSLSYGSSSICNIPSTQTFSISNFLCNLPTNTYYFLGAYNGHTYFPTYFTPMTTVIAAIGLLALIVIGYGDRRKLLLMLGLWILVYHFFCDFFYAGAVTFGVDVRFIIEIFPAIAIFAGIGIDGLSRAAGYAGLRLFRLKRRKAQALSDAASVVFIIAFVVYPFIFASNAITMQPQSMPQEPYPLTATNFIHTNYNSVPTNCLVFSFTPDIWYELNRSAAQVGYLGSTDSNFTSFASRYSCFVLDYGYWCVVPPNNGGMCRTDITSYSVSRIVSAPGAPGSLGNLTIYLINNYTAVAPRPGVAPHSS